MKNIEKYSKEILEYASSTEKAIAVCKETMKPCDCSATSIRCKNCICSVDDSCEDEPLYKWAMAEYVEPVVISESDRAFLDYLKDKWKYMTRSKAGELSVYINKPSKDECFGIWYDVARNTLPNSLKLLELNFPMVKWEDAEPWKIEDLKKLEVCDEYGEDI